jgi:hypothetical protein
MNKEYFKLLVKLNVSPNELYVLLIYYYMNLSNFENLVNFRGFYQENLDNKILDKYTEKLVIQDLLKKKLLIKTDKKIEASEKVKIAFIKQFEIAELIRAYPALVVINDVKYLLKSDINKAEIENKIIECFIDSETIHKLIDYVKKATKDNNPLVKMKIDKFFDNNVYLDLINFYENDNTIKINNDSTTIETEL